MKKVSLLIAVLGLSTKMMASDLPDSSVVKNRLDAVDVFSVQSVEVKKQEYTPASSNSVATVKGIVEIQLTVQGNICSANPKSLAVSFSELKSKVKGQRDQKVSLFVSAKHDADPFDAMSACLSYARSSKVTLPLAIEEYIFDGESLPAYRFVFLATDMIGTGDSKNVAVLVKINENKEIEATIEQ